eukprot:TRINITY_DN17957_c1_g1_i1.p1 TRINITY_DN17957_c1_g1~~TRINITY_DN17957_c1_g1_i1.p1  ORF type:complete len:660 (+),score=125.11 TRINITY_DN17957_c1_g1_i1:46-2025(+)
MSGYITRELLQGASETSDLFDEYLDILAGSQQGSNTHYTVSAVSEVPGAGQIGVADELGILRLVNLADNTFRLFVIAQKEGRKPWKEPFSDIHASEAPDASGIAALQGTHIQTMSFEQQDGGYCLFLSLKYSPLILHTGWTSDPTNMSYEVYVFGRHSREVSSLKCDCSYVATGDEGGSLKVWNSEDKLLTTEVNPLYSVDELHTSGITSISFISDYIVTGSSDNTINVILCSTGHIHRQLLVDSGRVTCISSFGSRDHFCVGNDRGGYVILDTQGEVLHLHSSFTTANSITCISTAPPEASTYAIGCSNGLLEFYSKDDFTMIKTFSTRGGCDNPCIYSGSVMLEGVYSTVAITANGAVWVIPSSKVIPLTASSKEDEEDEEEVDANEVSQQNDHPEGDNESHGDVANTTESVNQRSLPQADVPTTPIREEHEREIANPHLVASPSHDETIWNATISTQSDQVLPAVKRVSPESKRNTVTPAPVFTTDLAFKNRQKAMAMRDLPVSSSTSSMSKPSGDRRKLLQNHIQKMESEEFDCEKYKKSHPDEYNKQLMRHPPRDPTNYSNSARRYTDLPSLAASSDVGDGLSLVKQVPKQLSQNWIASQELKPPSSLPLLLQEDLIRSEWTGDLYECPLPPPSFSLEVLTNSFASSTRPHMFM